MTGYGWMLEQNGIDPVFHVSHNDRLWNEGREGVGLTASATLAVMEASRMGDADEVQTSSTAPDTEIIPYSAVRETSNNVRQE